MKENLKDIYKKNMEYQNNQTFWVEKKVEILYLERERKTLEKA